MKNKNTVGIFFAGAATPSSSRDFLRPAGARNPVRIPRPKIGKRPAQQDILQAQSVRILAKGEIPETWRDSIEILQRKY